MIQLILCTHAVKNPKQLFTASCASIFILHPRRLELVDDICSLKSITKKSLKNLLLGAEDFI